MHFVERQLSFEDHELDISRAGKIAYTLRYRLGSVSTPTRSHVFVSEEVWASNPEDAAEKAITRMIGEETDYILTDPKTSRLKITEGNRDEIWVNPYDYAPSLREKLALVEEMSPKLQVIIGGKQ